jgi:hypothetical protein
VRGQGLVLTALTDGFRALAPWPAEGDLPPDGWERYSASASEVQGAEPGDVERAFEEFLSERSGIEGARDETCLFLLQRVVFDLPEAAPESERRPFKGWVNWPPPDADGNVSLAWPLSWRQAGPTLVAPYEGSEGRPYDAVGEYRHLRERYAFRELPDPSV